MKTLGVIFALIAFGLMGFMGGCEGKAPVVHMCKAYADKVTCDADAACRWDDSRCKAKPGV